MKQHLYTKVYSLYKRIWNQSLTENVETRTRLWDIAIISLYNVLSKAARIIWLTHRAKQLTLLFECCQICHARNFTFHSWFWRVNHFNEWMARKWLPKICETVSNIPLDRLVIFSRWLITSTMSHGQAHRETRCLDRKSMMTNLQLRHTPRNRVITVPRLLVLVTQRTTILLRFLFTFGRR